jgi:alkanesulfonate monooxygenase SsuD/methylene tetrahydromethanopterin reductase-like flavin-dependent oxidoreductase (luciferase family)
MRVGIYTDLRNPPPWRRDWAGHYARVLDRIVEAERLGAGSVWLSEHHLFEDGYLPQPLTFAAAVAARTRSVRIGTAIMLAPLRPALDIAEQAAVVDIVSGGRLDLGLGLGYRIPEFEAYGQDIAQRYPALESRVRDIRRMWGDGTCTPPPVQPRPPIWVGATGPRAARLAGRLGEGLLWLASALLEPYRRGLAEGGHDPAAARMAGLANLVLADDPEAAWPRIAPHLAYQRNSYNRYGAEGRTDAAGGPSTLDPTGAEVDVEALRQPADEAIPPAFDVVTPDEAIARMTRWLGPLPVADVYLWESIAGMPDDLADRHVELVATRVAPALADVGIAVPANQSSV